MEIPLVREDLRALSLPKLRLTKLEGVQKTHSSQSYAHEHSVSVIDQQQSVECAYNRGVNNVLELYIITVVVVVHGASHNTSFGFPHQNQFIGVTGNHHLNRCDGKKLEPLEKVSVQSHTFYPPDPTNK